ncbi:DMT family transporter [Fulvivirga sp. RKSG066]|uniref:DMT family transporter n=1 Tax=Fulvivirga aurantia TaxID=2529383 RepID=UPI0012BC0909|nr:DMT family transporter [Fulvivirga aurantia]MTI20648.1 DMT family transporter [Fulvivirga aurantia]
MIDLIVPTKLKIHSILLFVTFIYGANYTVAKIAMPAYLEPFGFILLRVTCGTLLFWIFSYFTGTEKVHKRDLGLLFLCGIFGVATNQMLFFSGLNLTTPINASVIMTTSPIAVMITAYFLGKEKITWLKIVGVLVGALGAFLLITKDGASLNKGTFLGDLLVLINGASYAVYLVIVKPLMARYKATTVIKWVFFFGWLIIIPFGTNQFLDVQWATIPMYVWLSIVFVIVMATFLVYLLNVWSLKFVNSSVVGIYMYLQPVFATIVAISVRHDPLDFTTIAYSLIIMTGVYLVSKK